MPEALDNLDDPYTRSEVSDWGVNTIRDMWPAVFKQYMQARVPDSKLLLKQMLQEEFERIKKGRLDLAGYLRARRTGSPFLLNRKLRLALYAHYASKRAR